MPHSCNYFVINTDYLYTNASFASSAPYLFNLPVVIDRVFILPERRINMLFTSTPLLQSLERMMRQIPRYRPEIEPPEIHIGTYATEIQKAELLPDGSYSIDRVINAEKVPWVILIFHIASLFNNPQFSDRIRNDIYRISEVNIMYFMSPLHRRIFMQSIKERKVTRRSFIAAVYLLTSNTRFWNRIKYHIQMESIYFDNFHMTGCSTEEYTLFCCAKDLYTGTRHITITDLSDPEVISTNLFRLICNAMTITRYGIITPKGESNS